MGGDGRMLVQLKRDMHLGESVGPDIFFSSLIADPIFFEKDPRPKYGSRAAKTGNEPWQRAVTPQTDLKQMISEIRAFGATALKLYSGLNKDLIKQLSLEAKKQGLAVWGHGALPPCRPSEVSEAGIEVISHAGHLFDYEFIDAGS